MMKLPPNKGQISLKNSTFLSIRKRITIHLGIKNTFILYLIPKQSKWLSESTIYKSPKTQNQQKILFKSMDIIEFDVYSKY